MKTLLITLMISLLVTGCGVKIDETICTNIKDSTTCTNADTQVTDIKELHATAINVLTALKNNDSTKLSKLISTDGIRFSPYSYVNISSDIVITQTNIATMMKNNEKHTRWNEDGTWDPINMTFQEYRQRYIYDAKFMTEGIPYINTIVQRGNTINNVYDVYSGDMIVEYYIPGTSKLYKWMDRKSLTIVFTKENKQRKVRAITHGERTI